MTTNGRRWHAGRACDCAISPSDCHRVTGREEQHADGLYERAAAAFRADHEVGAHLVDPVQPTLRVADLLLTPRKRESCTCASTMLSGSARTRRKYSTYSGCVSGFFAK